MKNYLVVVPVVVSLFVGACASKPPSDDENENKFASYVEGDYKIGVDDRVQVTVWRNPELSVTVPVRRA